MLTAPQWKIVQEAYRLLKYENIYGVMVGTGALAAHGYDVGFKDFDFLCERGPELQGVPFTQPGSTPNSSISCNIEGFEIDYIEADEDRIQFMTSVPTMINGVAIASVKDIIGLKRFANRHQDKKFFQLWDANIFTKK